MREVLSSFGKAYAVVRTGVDGTRVIGPVLVPTTKPTDLVCI